MPPNLECHLWNMTLLMPCSRNSSGAGEFPPGLLEDGDDLAIGKTARVHAELSKNLNLENSTFKRDHLVVGLPKTRCDSQNQFNTDSVACLTPCLVLSSAPYLEKLCPGRIVSATSSTARVNVEGSVMDESNRTRIVLWPAPATLVTPRIFFAASNSSARFSVGQPAHSKSRTGSGAIERLVVGMVAPR